MVFGLIGAAIGGVASIVGANKNKKAQNAANAANVQMQNDANEANERLAERANNWNIDQWNRQNEYNDPAAIRARMEAAGFNPLSAIGVGTGTAGSVAPATSSQWGAAQVNAAQVAPTMVGDAISSFGNQFGEALTQYGADRSRASILEVQNRELQKKLSKVAITPRVGGIHGGGDIPAVHLGNAQLKGPSLGRTIGAAARNGSKKSDEWDTDPKGKASTDEGYRSGTKSGLFQGLKWERSGLFSDGEWGEAAYADLGGSLWGLASLGSDIGHNARRAYDHYTQRPTYHDQKSAPKRNVRYTAAQHARESAQLYKQQPKSMLERQRELRQKYPR